MHVSKPNSWDFSRLNWRFWESYVLSQTHSAGAGTSEQRALGAECASRAGRDRGGTASESPTVPEQGTEQPRQLSQESRPSHKPAEVRVKRAGPWLQSSSDQRWVSKQLLSELGLSDLLFQATQLHYFSWPWAQAAKPPGRESGGMCKGTENYIIFCPKHSPFLACRLKFSRGNLWEIQILNANYYCSLSFSGILFIGCLSSVCISVSCYCTKWTLTMLEFLTRKCPKHK